MTIRNAESCRYAAAESRADGSIIAINSAGGFRMRSLILAIAIAGLFVGTTAFAHGRHGGGAHASSFAKSSSQSGFNDSATSASSDARTDPKTNANAGPAAHDADTDKPHRKSGRAPDEEEVMQAEH